MKKNLTFCLKYSSVLFLGFLFLTCISSSQAPPVEWEKTYVPDFMSLQMSGGGYCVHQLQDEGYIASGIGTTPIVNAYVVRTDKNGDTLWTAKQFQDVNKGLISNCTGVLPIDDGGFLVYSHGTIDQQQNRVIFLMKFKSDGSLDWDKSYGLGNYDFVETGGMQFSNDGGVVMTGYVYQDDFQTKPDIFLLKTDLSGNELYFEFYGEPDAHELGYSVTQAHGGGYIVTGSYEDVGTVGKETLFLKIKEDGQLDWQKFYSDEPPYEYNCIRQTPDGGYAVAGTDGGKFVLMETNTDLDVLWMKKYGVDKDAEHAYSFDLTSDGGYILTGWAQEPQGNTKRKLWVVKTDGAGNKKWDLKLGGNLKNSGECIRQTADGGYIITGTRENDERMSELYLVKLGPDVNGILENATKNRFEVVPNPVKSTFKITFNPEKAAKVNLTLFDLQGKPIAELFDGMANQGKNEIAFNADSFDAGMYYCILNISGENSLLLINITK